METSFTVERLTHSDIAENVALVHGVGWRDSETDWQVVHDAALVLGVRREGSLVAEGALGVYGDAGTIAKMVVEARFQRHGLGSRILSALMSEAEHRGISTLGLVATPFGRPLYERRGFVPVGEVVVLTGTPDIAEPAEAAAPLVTVEPALRAERRFIACDRGTMLAARLRVAIASSSLGGDADAPRGYAMATAQGDNALVGPIIAQDEPAARALFSSIHRRVGGAVRIDVPGELGSFRQWLCSLGLVEQGVRVEMARGAERLPWQVPERFALAAQAWG